MPIQANPTVHSTEMERMERDMERSAQSQVIDFAVMERMERMERRYTHARAHVHHAADSHTCTTHSRAYTSRSMRSMRSMIDSHTFFSRACVPCRVPCVPCSRARASIFLFC